MYSYDEMITAIRSGEILPGTEIERSYDDDDLYWEFDFDSVISFAIGIDIPGTYSTEPYWGMYVRKVEGDLLFAEQVTEGDGSDQTRFIATIGVDDSLNDLVANFIMSDDFEMQFAVLNHFKPERFAIWEYFPAEALDEFAWCRTTLSKKDIDEISAKLTSESPTYRALCEFFDTPDDAKWLGYKEDFVRHDNLTKFYEVFKWRKPNELSPESQLFTYWIAKESESLEEVERAVDETGSLENKTALALAKEITSTEVGDDFLEDFEIYGALEKIGATQFWYVANSGPFSTDVSETALVRMDSQVWIVASGASFTSLAIQSLGDASYVEMIARFITDSGAGFAAAITLEGMSHSDDDLSVLAHDAHELIHFQTDTRWGRTEGLREILLDSNSDYRSLATAFRNPELPESIALLKELRIAVENEHAGRFAGERF